MKYPLLFPPTRRAGLALAIAAALLGAGGCKRPAAAKAKPAPPPAIQLADADVAVAEKFGHELAAAIKANDGKTVSSSCDFEALWTTIIQHLEAPKQFLTGAKQGFLNSIEKQPGGLFREAVGKDVRLMRVRQKAGESVLLLRVRHGDDGGASYLDVFLTRQPDGTFRVRDFFNYALGEKLSDVMARLLAQGLAAESQSPLEKILKGKNAASGDFAKAMKAVLALREGRPAEMLSLSDALPDAVRKERFVQFTRIQAAMALNDEARYLKVLDEMAATFPNDPSLAFILIDRHFLKKDYTKAISTLELLIADLGNDAFLSSLHATCLQELGRTDEAIGAISAGLKAEPGDSMLLWAQVGVLAQAKRFAEVVKVLDEILELHEAVADPDRAAEVGLTEFFASPEGKTYVARMKKLGNL